MTYRTLLVSLNEVDRIDQVLAVAGEIAGRHQSHVTGLYVIPAVQVYPTIGMEITPDVFEGHRAFFKQRAEKVRAQFGEFTRRQAINSQDCRVIDSMSPLVADCVIDEGRYADLVIVSQVNRDGEEGVELDFDERVIMETGRPVLIVPRATGAQFTARQIVVGWNGTQESARAVFDALPLLKRAEDVRIVWVDPQKSPDEAGDMPGAEIADTLARHGVKATAEPMPTRGGSAGEALLTKVRDLGADMLVIGAYGHSRMREFVFGGATRYVLRHAHMPVLMSH